MPELTVVVGTLNEAANVRPLVERLDRALRGIDWEVVFVDDDSPDGTAEVARELAASDPRVRVLQRIGRRGLSSACIEGMLASAAPCVAVMDADLQHDETLLPAMLARLRAEDLDLVIGSRYVEGGSTGAFAEGRRRLSGAGTWLGRLVVPPGVRDPLSGFFMLRRAFLREIVHDLSGTGFKILLDLLGSARRPVRFAELPYRLGERLHGESKLDTLVSLEYLLLLAEKLVGDVVPVRFVLFVLVGLGGVGVHLAVLWVAFRVVGAAFYPSQVTATVVAMTGNFFLNNATTYRDRRLRGGALWRGLLFFYLACAVGALASFQLAERLYQLGLHWLLAGLLGAVVGAVWNYGITSVTTWRTERRRR